MKMTFTFVLALISVAEAQTNTPTFVTNVMFGKKFVWERVTEVGTTNTIIRRVDEVAPMQAVTNAPANVTNRTSQTKGGKYVSPPTFIAPGSATNYMAPPKPTNTFVYGEQRVWYPTNEVQAAMREHAIARLQGKEGSVWGNVGPVDTASSGLTEYIVDQRRPLDTGSFPVQQYIYPIQSQIYPTPVSYYPSYSYDYYSYPGYGYYEGRNLFGVEFDAFVNPAYGGYRWSGGQRHRQWEHSNRFERPNPVSGPPPQQNRVPFLGGARPTGGNIFPSGGQRPEIGGQGPQGNLVMPNVAGQLPSSGGQMPRPSGQFLIPGERPRH